MSFLGLGHFRHYSDSEWTNVKNALTAAGVDPGTGVMFTETQHAVAELLANDPLVQAAKDAISTLMNSDVPVVQRLAEAAARVVPAIATFLTAGGAQIEIGKLTSLATTFTQEVWNLHYSSSIDEALRAVETAVANPSA